jgi:hypothetical protein
MPAPLKKIELTSINPTLSIGGISLTTAIANVQIDTKPDGTATFFVVGKITDTNEVDQLKGYLQNI